MMFAREPSVAAAERSRGAVPLPSYSPSSPLRYLPMSFSPHENATPPSPPVKIEAGMTANGRSTDELLMSLPMATPKKEPLSPPPMFYNIRTTRPDMQTSPCGSSLESLSPYSPLSAMVNTAPSHAMGLSPGTSPMSPVSISTLSPSAKTGREDLSPASSINSGCNNDKKKKLGGGRQSEDLCLVCGDRASGYHYNALTCEGCKGFFRRSITKNSVYTCKYGKNCEMDMYMRRKCQECRMKKCINVGMRAECVVQGCDAPPSSPTGVVPEKQCRQKRDQKKEKEKLKENSSMSYQGGHELGGDITSSLPSTLDYCQMKLTKEHNELINRLTELQDVYENPKEPLDEIFSGKKTTMEIIAFLTEITVELIVHFCTKLPGYEEFNTDDRVIMIKECSGELMVLRAARRYDIETDSIVFADGSPCTRQFYRDAGMVEENTLKLWSFCRKMALMKVDNAEYALLSAIIFFSERPNVKNLPALEKLQFIYVEALSAYISNKHPSSLAGVMLGKLLDVVTQARTLHHLNNMQCETIISENNPLPDLLTEIWDIQKKPT